MNAEQRLREKLRKIEALFAGAATVGEKAAAGAAAERIRRQFSETSSRENQRNSSFRFLILGRDNSLQPCAVATASGHFAIHVCIARLSSFAHQPAS